MYTLIPWLLTEVTLPFTGSLLSKYQTSCPLTISQVVPRIIPAPRHMYPFRNKAVFYGKEFLAPRPTPNIEDIFLQIVRDCLSNIFAATLHIGGRSSMIFKVSRALFRNMHCYAVYLCNGDGSCSQRGKNGIFVWYLHELRCSITIFVLTL